MTASNYSLVAFVKPPSLEANDQPALIKFKTSYSAYTAKIEYINKDRGQEDQLTAATIKDCIKSATLHALCILGEIDGA